MDRAGNGFFPDATTCEVARRRLAAIGVSDTDGARASTLCRNTCSVLNANSQQLAYRMCTDSTVMVSKCCGDRAPPCAAGRVMWNMSSQNYKRHWTIFFILNLSLDIFSLRLTIGLCCVTELRDSYRTNVSDGDIRGFRWPGGLPLRRGPMDCVDAPESFRESRVFVNDARFALEVSSASSENVRTRRH